MYSSSCSSVSGIPNLITLREHLQVLDPNLDIFVTCCLIFFSYGFDMVVFGLVRFILHSNTAGQHLYICL